MSASSASQERAHGAVLVAKVFEDSGKHLTALSASFLIACLYILATVSSVDHRSLLLLGGSLSLPLLGVSISLIGFFVFAPLLVLVLHVNLLIQSRILTRKVSSPYRQDLLGDDHHFLLFPSLPILHRLWKDERGFKVLVAGAIASTNIILPLVVLCYMQYKFIPSHLFFVTLIHQVIVTLDSVFLWYFFVRLPGEPAARVEVLIASSIAVAFSWFLAIVPHTLIEDLGIKLCFQLDDRNIVLSSELVVKDPPAPELLAVAAARGKSRFDVLVKYASGAPLAGRNLREASLDGCHLFNADLRGVNLQDASLVGVDLRRADLSPASAEPLDGKVTNVATSASSVEDCEDSVIPGAACLDGASMRGADLRGANLSFAKMRGVDLRDARLRGANLRGADLRGAHLEGASLSRVNLEHARLDNAFLEGARLNEAILDGASIVGASLHGVRAGKASFNEVQMEGVQLTGAWLRGSDFRAASVAGSDFRMANLKDVRSLALNATNLRGARFRGTCDVTLVDLIDLRSIVYTQSSGNFEDGKPLRNSLLDYGPALCFGYGGSLHKRLLYDRDVFPGWPLPEQQLRAEAGSRAAIVWNQAEFARQFADELLDQACLMEGLVDTVARRAAGELNPGDLTVDLELARQLAKRLEEETACASLRNIDETRKQRIEWRLRRAERESEW